MIKLIATDMDGTLLDSNNTINPEFYEVFEKLKEKDVIFAAASGRQYYNLIDRFEDIKDNMMFIAENGTFVMHKGKEVLVNSLDKQLAIELIKIGQTIENSYVILCGKNSAYISNTDEKFMEQVISMMEEIFDKKINKSNTSENNEDKNSIINKDCFEELFLSWSKSTINILLLFNISYFKVGYKESFGRILQ